MNYLQTADGKDLPHIVVVHGGYVHVYSFDIPLTMDIGEFSGSRVVEFLLEAPSCLRIVHLISPDYLLAGKPVEPAYDSLYTLCITMPTYSLETKSNRFTIPTKTHY